MSKNKSVKKKTRAASSTRRKGASKSRSRRTKAAGRPSARTVQLKPIKVLVDRAITDLQKLPPTDAIEQTLKHLQTCSLAFEDICNPETPGGCAPTMEFPREALAISR